MEGGGEVALLEIDQQSFVFTASLAHQTAFKTIEATAGVLIRCSLLSYSINNDHKARKRCGSPCEVSENFFVRCFCNSDFVITFVVTQPAGLSLARRSVRKVRATQGTILLNGKLFARIE